MKRTHLLLTLIVAFSLAAFSTPASPLDDCEKVSINTDSALQARANALRQIPLSWSNAEPSRYLSRAERRVPCLALLHNLDRVSPNIFRGGQPKLRQASDQQSIDGITLLHAMGVTDILDLRKPSPDETRERERASEEHLTFHSIPLPSFDIGLPLIGSDFDKHAPEVACAVRLIRDLEAQGHTVYVHCAHGADRTGVVIALSRLLGGAPLKAAMTEAEDHSLSHFQRGMRDFINDYAKPEKLAEFRRLVNV